ncbi:VasL domain-containing protein [Buttiauxella gaviniae]|uniref:VasL domain-containing protein n=1 Tax=Buttiauxella gaviniae TaxID=82990 RepID=A0ABV3NY69_9ENTR
MTKINPSVKPGEVKISCHDPRHHQEFLLLSNSVNTWKGHVHDRSWWLTQENQCLEMFERHGYDLQSGVWFCLISCQRHGWSGMANATLLLAEGFGKKQRQCWPPLAATDLRQQIIEWYSTHAATCVYGLPLTSAEVETLSKLESAVSLLLEHALSLQSKSQAPLRNLLDYLQSSRQSLQNRTVREKPAVIPEYPSVPVEATALPPFSTQSLAPSSRPWKAWFTGGVSGIALTLCAVGGITWLERPTTASYLDKIWPGNALSARWKSHLAEQTAGLPTINSWAQVNNQLNNLEQRLLAAEQKRKPYMTISELKTEVYQMRQTLQQGGEPVLAQLDDLQNKRDNKQPISAAEIEVISRHLEALNSRLIQLSFKK